MRPARAAETDLVPARAWWAMRLFLVALSLALLLTLMLPSIDATCHVCTRDGAPEPVAQLARYLSGHLP